MGVCQACVVQVEGTSAKRACMEPAVDGMRIRRYSGVGNVDSPRHSGALQEESFEANLEPELLIIGAGPAGLSAACTAAELGIDVVVLDERNKAGGQFFKQPTSQRPVPAALHDDRQFADGRRLIERAIRAGVKIVNGASVWGAFAGPELAVAIDGRTSIYRPHRLLVASGAYERTVPLPGWTAPRVMTTGAAQTLLRSYGVNAGDSILVAGNGPLNLQVALELHRAGANIALLAELAPMIDVSAPLNALRMFAAVPKLALQGGSLLADLRAARVPFRRGWGIAGIRQVGAQLEVDAGPVRQQKIEVHKTLTVDAVCMGYGFYPNNELLRMLGCRHLYDAGRQYLTTLRDESCETSVAGVYAVGDCCGLGGAPAAIEEGVLSALAIAESLGKTASAAQRDMKRAATAALKAHRRFQKSLWRLFRATSPALEWASADTEVCRCEHVTLADLTESIEAGCASLAAIKQRTRLGMGPCQGRYCTGPALQALAEAGNELPDEFSMFAPQAPSKPVTIAEVCTGDDVA